MSCEKPKPECDERQIRAESLRAAAQNLRHEYGRYLGLIDVVEALIAGLIDEGLVPPDFLIASLTKRNALWNTATPERPEGLNPHRGDATRLVLSTLHRVLRQRVATQARAAGSVDGSERPN